MLDKNPNPWRVYLLSEFHTHTSNSIARQKAECSHCQSQCVHPTIIQIAGTLCGFAFCKACASEAIERHWAGSLLQLSRLEERSDIQQLPRTNKSASNKKADPNQASIF
jgi:hypothetical protein